MQLSDAHCHYRADGKLAKIQTANAIPAIVNCGTPSEWTQNQALIGPAQRLSFGVHPWASDALNPAALTRYYQAAPVIGEIGLDTEWTKVPLSVQLPVFEAQLAIAVDLHKPVILHTKGQEATILPLLRRYPNRYFVHWYSSPDWQAEYLALDCYMSIGVDVVSDPAVQALAKAVPANRLLLESDGLESIAWAWHQPEAAVAYLAAMTTCAQRVAALRVTSVEAVTAQATSNLADFLNE